MGAEGEFEREAQMDARGGEGGRTEETQRTQKHP